jgi:hypothetical protein
VSTGEAGSQKDRHRKKEIRNREIRKEKRKEGIRKARK